MSEPSGSDTAPVSPLPGTEVFDSANLWCRYQSYRHSGGSVANDQMEEPAVWSAIGSPHDLKVLDLGCGDADFGLKLIELNCRSYIGIDSSRRMVELARKNLSGTSGTIIEGDVEQLGKLGLESGDVDLIICRLVAQYVENLPGLLQQCKDILAPGGRVVLTTIHPVITSNDYLSPDGGARSSWMVDRYFESGPRTRSWMSERVIWWHRTVQQHVEAFQNSGLTLETLSECAPAIDQFDDDGAELIRRRRVLLFLLILAKRLTEA